jgi:hypothetical protein
LLAGVAAICGPGPQPEMASSASAAVKAAQSRMFRLVMVMTGFCKGSILKGAPGAVKS